MPAPTFDQLYTLHARKLWLLACGLTGQPADADDLLQDSAIIALGRFSSFQPDSNFTAWMATIIRLTWNNLRRGSARRSTREQTLAAARPESTPPHHESPSLSIPAALSLPAHQLAFDDHLTQALHTLDPIPRACLLLHVVLDLPHSEISRLLDIPEGTTMSHVSRSRSRLRSLLSPPTPPTPAAPSPTHQEAPK